MSNFVDDEQRGSFRRLGLFEGRVVTVCGNHGSRTVTSIKDIHVDNNGVVVTVGERSKFRIRNSDLTSENWEGSYIRPPSVSRDVKYRLYPRDLVNEEANDRAELRRLLAAIDVDRIDSLDGTRLYAALSIIVAKQLR